MTNAPLAADLLSALNPPPPPSPETGPIPRENVKILLRMLGYVDADSVREVSIRPTRILVEHVALNHEGAVTIRNGELAYEVTEHPILEEDDHREQS